MERRARPPVPAAERARERPTASRTLGHQPGNPRSDQPRHHPGGRGECQHARFGLAPRSHARWRRRQWRRWRRHPTLQRAAGDQRRHRGGETTDEQSSRKERNTQHERERRAALVGQESGDDDADKLGEQERGKGPAVEIDAPQIGGDRGKHGRHGERLEGDKGDGEQETDGEPDPTGPERALVGLRRRLSPLRDRAPDGVQTPPCRARTTRRPSADIPRGSRPSAAADPGPPPGARLPTRRPPRTSNPNQRWLDARSWLASFAIEQSPERLRHPGGGAHHLLAVVGGPGTSRHAADPRHRHPPRRRLPRRHHLPAHRAQLGARADLASAVDLIAGHLSARDPARSSSSGRPAPGSLNSSPARTKWPGAPSTNW